jgi:hypothetical protein
MPPHILTSSPCCQCLLLCNVSRSSLCFLRFPILQPTKPPTLSAFACKPGTSGCRNPWSDGSSTALVVVTSTLLIFRFLLLKIGSGGRSDSGLQSIVLPLIQGANGPVLRDFCLKVSRDGDWSVRPLDPSTGYEMSIRDLSRRSATRSYMERLDT